MIADVSGHGVSAGMLMSSLQTALRTMAPDTDSPAEILERINRFYIHNINFTTFVTVFLARFDPASLTLTMSMPGIIRQLSIIKEIPRSPGLPDCTGNRPGRGIPSQN